MKRYIDADKLKESIKESGLFDSGEIEVISSLVEEQPTLEVDIPHGDLIDRNTVNKKLIDNLSGDSALWQAKKALYSTDTVIAAEE